MSIFEKCTLSLTFVPCCGAATVFTAMRFKVLGLIVVVLGVVETSFACVKLLLSVSLLYVVDDLSFVVTLLVFVVDWLAVAFCGDCMLLLVSLTVALSLIVTLGWSAVAVCVLSFSWRLSTFLVVLFSLGAVVSFFDWFNSPFVCSAALASWPLNPKINVVPTKIEAVPTEYFLIENLFNRFGIMPFLFVAVFLLFI